MITAKTATLALASALFAGPTVAQDWSGHWYGITSGYGSGGYDLGVSALAQGGPSIDVDNPLLGLRYTRNLHRGPAVFGFDAEVSSGPDGISPVGTEGTDWMCFTGDCNLSIKRLVTLRGRYGLLVAPTTLAYGAVGVAVGRVEGGIFDSEQQGASTAFGYTVAIGLEHMVKTNVTLFTEADFVDLGTLDLGTDGFVNRFDAVGDFTTVKLGVNLRF